LRLEGLGILRKINYFVGSGTSDATSFSIVPHPTIQMCAALYYMFHTILTINSHFVSVEMVTINSQCVPVEMVTINSQCVPVEMVTINSQCVPVEMYHISFQVGTEFLYITGT
jgi:hypothetical protein